MRAIGMTRRQTRSMIRLEAAHRGAVRRAARSRSSVCSSGGSRPPPFPASIISQRGHSVGHPRDLCRQLRPSPDCSPLRSRLDAPHASTCSTPSRRRDSPVCGRRPGGRCRGGVGGAGTHPPRLGGRGAAVSSGERSVRPDRWASRDHHAVGRPPRGLRRGRGGTSMGSTAACRADRHRRIGAVARHQVGEAPDRTRSAAATPRCRAGARLRANGARVPVGARPRSPRCLRCVPLDAGRCASSR